MDMNTLVLVALGGFIASIFTSWRSGKRQGQEIEEKGLAFLPDNAERFLRAQPIHDEYYAVHRVCLQGHYNDVMALRDRNKNIQVLLAEITNLKSELEEAQADNEQLKKDIKKWEDLATGKPCVVDLKS